MPTPKDKVSNNFSDETAADIGHFKGCPRYSTDLRYKSHAPQPPVEGRECKCVCHRPGLWEEEFDRDFINLGCAVQHDLKILIRKAIQGAEQKGYERGVKETVDKESVIWDTAQVQARQATLKELLEIIKTKLKNDPNNPVLMTGLGYVKILLEGKLKEKPKQ